MLKSHTMLALIWILWCGFHSLLITPEVTGLARRLLGERFHYYRLAYSLFSLVTIAPVLLYEYSLASPRLLSWSGGLALVRWPVLFLGIVVGASAARLYGPLNLFGLRVLLGGGRGLEDSLITEGILGKIRHPLYLSGILILWTSRSVTLARATTAAVLSAYLVAGALLEERKIAARFGREYIDYMARVPRFIPVDWVRRKIFGG